MTIITNLTGICHPLKRWMYWEARNAYQSNQQNYKSFSHRNPEPRSPKWGNLLLVTTTPWSYFVSSTSRPHATYRVRSESRCALRLRYVDLVVSISFAFEVCCCFTVFSC
jgi:hypothetical protein